MIELAKFQLDVGLSTATDREMLAFWRDGLGLDDDGHLGVGRGVRQYRQSFRGSIVKINHHRDGLDPAPAAGHRRVLLARPGPGGAVDTADPDGNEVTLVPPGWQGVTQLALETGVRDLDEHVDFWSRIVGLPREHRSDVPAFRVGDSVIRLVHDPDAPSDATRSGAGYRYCTLQVFDADAEHRRCVAAGAIIGHEPFTHGEVARYGFIRDPDGNWIELSQRASLTGPLPD